MARHSMLALLLMLTYGLAVPAFPEEPPSPVLGFLSPRTRLLVVAPHPDDETLGAGGLMQRVLQLGGAVQVVFMTSGDGFPNGVALAQHTLHPTARDYREYGRRRQEEARQALMTLGIPEKSIIFLGFPDAGLCPLRMQYPIDTGIDYTSPFTLEDRPPAADALVPDIEYNSEDLQRELAWILYHFRPSLVVTTHSQDKHPDHCATHLFVQKALYDLQQLDPRWQPVLLTFLIHFGGWWPVAQDVSLASPLLPPPGFPDHEPPWLPLPLSSAELQTKRQAVLQYHSQMLAMGSYLLSFVRANELFAREPFDDQSTLQQLPGCHR